MYSPKKTTFATLEVVDSQAMGQGGQGGAKGADLFAGVRNADALVLVVRAFEDPSVPHPKSTVDPARDLADLEAEILLNDMAIVETRLERIGKQKRIGKTAELEREEAVLLRCKATLDQETPLRELVFDRDEERVLRGFQLLSRKPLLVVYNVGSGQAFAPPAGRTGVTTVVLPCADEREVAQLPEADRAQFREAYGISEDGLHVLVRSAYRLLGLISFLTAGEDEVRAWTIQDGDSAVDAAGAIHSDLAQGSCARRCCPTGSSSRRGRSRKRGKRAGSGPRAGTTGWSTATSCTSCTTNNLERPVAPGLSFHTRKGGDPVHSSNTGSTEDRGGGSS
jgi:ribosome-binding ATPase YchF (GTP1/OBG family)